MAVRDGAHLGERRGRHGGKVALAPSAGAARVGAGEQQQVGDQAAHAARRAERRSDHLALLAAPLGRLQPLLEQLQVGEDAGQRGAQLVRGVGDELALRLHHLLRLRAGRVELAEHLVQGAGQLADLVVRPRIGDPERGVSRGGDLPRPGGERRDRPHRAPGDRDSGQGRQQGAAEHAARQEQPEPVDGRLQAVGAAAVLDVHVAKCERGSRGDAHRAYVRDGVRLGWPEARGPGGALLADEDVWSDHANCGVLDERRLAAKPAPRLAGEGILGDGDLSRQPGSVVAKLVVEAALEAVRRQPPHHDREDDQDDQRQGGRDRRQPPANRPALRRQRREEALKPLHPEPP